MTTRDTRIQEVAIVKYWSGPGVRERYTHPQVDFFHEGYAPSGGYIKDYHIIKRGDVFHLFHITGNPLQECHDPGNEIFFGHATTRDFETWTNHLPVMFIIPGTWEGGHVCDPMIIEHGGRYVMFYTGNTIEYSQQIGAAFSDDLFTWTRCEHNPLWNPQVAHWTYWRREAFNSCRGPFIVRHNDKFHLYYLTRNKAKEGVLGMAMSADLINWEDAGQVVDKHPNVPEYEAATIHERNGSWFFSVYAQDPVTRMLRTHYLISDRLDYFDTRQLKPIWEDGLIELKLVEKDNASDRWLVMAFYWDATRPLGDPNHNPKNGRVHLGILDWNSDPLSISTVADSSQIKPFLQLDTAGSKLP